MGCAAGVGEWAKDAAGQQRARTAEKQVASTALATMHAQLHRMSRQVTQHVHRQLHNGVLPACPEAEISSLASGLVLFVKYINGPIAFYASISLLFCSYATGPTSMAALCTIGTLKRWYRAA